MKICFSLLAMLCLSLPLFSQTADDETAIRKLVKTMSEGWTAGSGQQFASVFANDHDFIVWNGLYSKGITVEENANNHQRIFNTFYKDTRLHYTIDKIKFIREDIALIHTYGAVVPKTQKRPKDPQVLWTALLEKIDGAWKIISFHNVDLEIFEDERLKKNIPTPVEVLYANWYAAAR